MKSTKAEVWTAIMVTISTGILAIGAWKVKKVMDKFSGGLGGLLG